MLHHNFIFTLMYIIAMCVCTGGGQDVEHHVIKCVAPAAAAQLPRNASRAGRPPLPPKKTTRTAAAASTAVHAQPVAKPGEAAVGSTEPPTQPTAGDIIVMTSVNSRGDVIGTQQLVTKAKLGAGTFGEVHQAGLHQSSSSGVTAAGPFSSGNKTPSGFSSSNSSSNLPAGPVSNGSRTTQELGSNNSSSSGGALAYTTGSRSNIGSTRGPGSSSKSATALCLGDGSQDKAVKIFKVKSSANPSMVLPEVGNEYNAAAKSAEGFGREFLLIPESWGYVTIGQGDAAYRRPCILMPLAANGSVGDLLKGPDGQPRPLSPELTAYIISRLVHGVMRMHAGKHIHRDIKADNVLLFGTRQHPIPKLGDFGCWGAVSPAQSAFGICGTPAYQSIEQETGGAQDGGTDVHLLGKLLLHMRWGRFPFWYLASCQQEEDKKRRRQDPLTELTHMDCPYTRPASPGEPPPLTPEELQFLGKSLPKNALERLLTADLAKLDLVQNGLRTVVPLP